MFSANKKGAPVTAPTPYRSDRWVTPGVVVTLIVCVLLGLVSVVAAAAWLTSIGSDPGPMLEFVLQSIGGLTGSASLVLQLANRRTNTKTERNTGQQAAEIGALADAVYTVADALPKPVRRHEAPLTAPYREAAPAPRGS